MNATAMGLTINFSTARWELQFAILAQLEYRPVLVRWSNPEERGFILKFLCFVLRFGGDRR